MTSVLLWIGTVFCAGIQVTEEPEEPAAIKATPTQDILIKTVLENNRDLRVARESYRVAILEAGTGNTPPDPQVEFGYLFGNPSDMGNRIDFRVSQQVDFPTAYVHKSRVRSIRTSQAELEYLMTRQEVLLRARQLWIERIHLNQQEYLLRKRLQQARKINEHFQHKLVSGEVGQLVFGHSNLQLATLQNEVEQVLSELRVNQLAILEISGGIEVEIADTVFPEPAGLDPDTLFQAYLHSPEMQLYHHELELKEEQKNLAVSQNLPKFSAGYYSESVLDQRFKGFQVGVTVPLWENTNRIKQARTEISFAEAEAERYMYVQKRELMQKLDQLKSMDLRVRQMEEALNMINEPELLTIALENGEISLSEYFYASDFYFRNQQLLLRNKRDLLLKESDIMKVYL